MAAATSAFPFLLFPTRVVRAQRASCATLPALMSTQGAATTITDREVLAAFRAGAAVKDRKRAFEKLYRQNARAIYQRVLMPVLAEPALAEEALSITFRKVATKLDTFESRGTSLSAWITRIAKNTAIDLLRSERRVRDRRASFEAVTTLVLTAETPESKALQSDEARLQKQQIQHTLSTLHERYAQAIRLRFLEEKSRNECAEILGVKVATFDVILLRALRAFKKNWPEKRCTKASNEAQPESEHSND